MAQITIPKKLLKRDDLILVPRREYERLTRIFNYLPKSQWWFWTKEWQAKEKEADRDIKQGKLSGPYKNKRQLEAALARLKKS